MKFGRERGVLRQSFSTADVSRLTGLTARQLDHWDRLGFLGPSVARAAGSGSTRRYSYADVVRLRVAARLRASGVNLTRLRRCAEALSRLDRENAGDLARARLVVVGSRVLWARSNQELVDLLDEGQLVLVFSLGQAVAEVAGAVARLSRGSGSVRAEGRGARRLRRAR
jgi:DNA-binding transcriptional MerR regulator